MTRTDILKAVYPARVAGIVASGLIAVATARTPDGPLGPALSATAASRLNSPHGANQAEP